MRLIQTLMFALLFSAALTAQDKKAALTITPLTGNFYIFITSQPYLGSPVPANGMYLVTDSGVVMLDTPWDSTQFQPLLDSIQARHHQNVVLCIATHSHEDRTIGLEFLTRQGVKTYTSKQTDEICIAKNKKRAAFVFTKDTSFTVGQYRFNTFYAGEGHSPDNIVIWFETDKILYGGCLVKSTEASNLGNLSDANVQAWPGTIKKLQRQFPHPAYIIPGHQSWKSKRSLQHTLALLREYNKK